ncbi:WG repeat-containing protein [Hyphomonas sp.]|uniref:WG repeat-containing protein n=1 Tax=Hyphomonas sp. TaxID=87 RepID=UPI001D42DC8D|nr:WG repeat-containing protein [Hyphomonas sp.]MBU3920458.1 WG repeat-containing protein [Alphaproteobacteria bacterium]MBU4060461.1 WG repeat-containing protein [Alphaproteobacteria bacterium]MBU4163129.1 WG repeat-containing protein [Alphaproteobacteria bacterium]
MLRAFTLFPLLWAIGFFPALSAPEQNPEWSTDPDAVYISCSAVTAQYAENGVLIFYNSVGKEIARDEDGSASFQISPDGWSGRKACGIPISIGQNGKWALIMPDGTLFADRFFESTGALYNDVLVYSQNGRKGLIDRAGKVLVAPSYDQIHWNGDGKFRVEYQDKIFLLGEKGKRFSIEDDVNYSVKYKQRLASREAYLACPDGRKRKSKDGKWGLVDAEGKVILPFKYRALGCFKDGMAMVPDEGSRKWCAVQVGGAITKGSPCDIAYHFFNGSHYYPEQLSEDDFESSVLWNRAYLEYGEGRQVEPPRLMPDGVRAIHIRLAGPDWRDRSYFRPISPSKESP